MEIVEQLRQLAAEGLTQAEAAKRLGVKRSSVSYYARRFNIAFRRVVFTRITREQLEQAVNQGLSRKEIAYKFKLTWHQVHYYLIKYGLKVQKELVPEEKFKQAVEEGLTHLEIANRFGITIHQVRYLKAKYGVTQRRAGKRPPTKVINKNKKRFLELVDKGMTLAQISKAIGISYSTAHDWYNKLDLIRDENREEGDDPRSAVCKQIQSCSHKRCYLHTRCPAYRNYVNERLAKGLSI